MNFLHGPTPDSRSEAAGMPRLRSPDRSQPVPALDSHDLLVPHDHPVRLVWDYVGQLDLSPLMQNIKAVHGHAGRPATDPKLLFALWMWATLEGVCSGRHLESLLQRDAVYRWLCGGVFANYHTLDDFHSQQADLLDDILTQSITVLLDQGLVTLQCLAQDGMRTRASAGSASFHRRATLEEHYQQAQQHVQQLRQEKEQSPSASRTRDQAAQQRAKEQRQQRLQAALEALAEVETIKAKRGNRAEKPSEARASTTDPEARKMRMADGGTRPAYNVQFATEVDTGLIVGMAVTNQGSDAQQLEPMLQQIQTRYARKPQEMLVDGGFVTTQAIDALGVEADAVKLFGPLKKAKKDLESGQDPFAARKGDSAAMKTFRRRMSLLDSKAKYKKRCSTAEWVNAGCRNRGLNRFLVRGLSRVKPVTLFFVLVHHFVTLVRIAPASLGLRVRSEG